MVYDCLWFVRFSGFWFIELGIPWLIEFRVVVSWFFWSCWVVGLLLWLIICGYRFSGFCFVLFVDYVFVFAGVGWCCFCFACCLIVCECLFLMFV